MEDSILKPLNQVTYIKKTIPSNLPFTRLDRMKTRSWKFKKPEESKKSITDNQFYIKIKHKPMDIFLSSQTTQGNSHTFSNVELEEMLNSDLAKILTKHPLGIIKRKAASSSVKQNREIVEKELVSDLDKWIHQKKLPKYLNDPTSVFYRDKCIKKIRDDLNQQHESKDIDLFGKKLKFTNDIHIEEILKRKTLDTIKSVECTKSTPSLIDQTNNKQPNDKISSCQKNEKIAEEKVALELNLQTRYIYIAKLLDSKRQKLNDIVNKIASLKVDYQQKKMDRNRIEIALSINENSNSKDPNKMRRLEFKSKKTSELRQSPRDHQKFLFQREENLKSLNELKISMPSLLELINCLEKKRATIQSKITNLKYEIDRLRSDLSSYFHKILIEAKDTREDGISWIIRSIWEIGCNINLSKMPKFLDEETMKFLLIYTKKEMNLNELLQKYQQLKALQNCKPITIGNNIKENSDFFLKSVNLNFKKSEDEKSNFLVDKKSDENNNEKFSQSYSLSSLKVFRSEIIELEKQIDKLRKELRIIKMEETTRITREYVKGNYKSSEKESIERILRTVFGEQSTKKEMDKIMRFKEEYTKLKSNRISSFRAITTSQSLKSFASENKTNIQ